MELGTADSDCHGDDTAWDLPLTDSNYSVVLYSFTASVVLHSAENLNDSPGSNVLSAMALESACASSPRDCVER